MVPKLHFNQSSVTFDLRPLIFDASLMITDPGGICRPKNLDIAPNITSQHTLWATRDGLQKMQRF